MASVVNAVHKTPDDRSSRAGLRLVARQLRQPGLAGNETMRAVKGRPWTMPLLAELPNLTARRHAHGQVRSGAQ